MSYECHVVTLKEILPHPDPEVHSLAITDIYGYTVIVGKDTQPGTTVLYFPVDGRLGTEFADHNDLVRRKDENGNNAGGLFDLNRKVRAQKLRGVKSEGFCIPVESLEFTGGDWRSLKHGDKFNEFNGFVICEKFVTVKGVQNNPRQRFQDKKNAWFHKHAETEQFRFGVSTIKPGSLIHVTEKVHGCVHHTTTVRLADGTRKKIVNVNVGDEVFGYDEQTGEIRPTKVLSKFSFENDLNWLKLTFSGNRGLKCTQDHKIYTQRGWVRADELELTDTLYKPYPNAVLTGVQKQTIEKTLIPVSLTDISYFEKSVCHDIETETHNYVGNGILIHNSSARQGRVWDTVESNPTKLQKIKAKLTRKPIASTVQIVSMIGTRNVILGKTTGPGYYGENEGFRQTICKDWIDKLHDGEIVYGEIVGYLPSNASIMPAHDTSILKDKKFAKQYGKLMNYSYGCAPENPIKPQMRFFVYRITQTSFDRADDEPVELSWFQVKRRCSELGLQTVPEVTEPFLYDGNETELRSRIEELTEGDSTLDPSHIREGVCVRAEEPSGRMKIFKSKSFTFGCLEGYLSEQMEEQGTQDMESAS